MCGIVGFVNDKNNKREIIEEMANRMVHRGPDDKGFYIDENIALGHRRLAIIDIKSGKQPMKSIDNHCVIVFNGEIYNYEELKEELIHERYNFQTNSDTEVLLVGYQHWGYDVIKKLRGMFAFAIWDNEKKILFCGRDHFGIKPFYFYKNNDVFMFASEIKCFLEHPQFKKSLNRELLGPYLSFSFTPTEQTFFKDVYCLQPGTYLIYQDQKIDIEPYYQIEFSQTKQNLHSQVNKIAAIMKNSIKYHLISDQEVGAFLSSGIDSSYLVSLAKTKRTYTVGYNQKQYSEIDYAQDLAEKLNISNCSKIITKDEFMQAISKVLYHLDEPLADPSVISLYFLAKLASQNVKVVISGEGADEFFGGYNYYKSINELTFYQKIPFAIRHTIACFIKLFPEFKGRNFLIRNGTKIEENYIGVNQIFSEKERKKLLHFADNIKNKDITKEVFQQYENEDKLTKMQAIDIHFWLLKDILLKCDKMTMAHSVEARTPFVDKCVFQIAASLNSEYKVTSKQTKIALREAAKKVIPNASYKKKKLGFPVPLREWLKDDDVYNEISRTFQQDFIKEFFNQNYIIHLLKQHKLNKKDNYRKIWAIYMFIKWYEVFFMNEPIN